MLNDKQILTVDEFAELLGIGRTSAYKVVNATGFPAIRPTSGTIRIIKDEALAWMKKYRSM